MLIDGAEAASSIIHTRAAMEGRSAIKQNTADTNRPVQPRRRNKLTGRAAEEA